MKWAILLLFTLAVPVALIVLVVLSGFPDIPCQDGQWSDAQQTCIPD